MHLPPVRPATARDLTRWVLRRLRRVRVVGASMEPTLSDGDVVFVDTRSLTHGTPQDLDIVVARHPQQPDLEIIKRVEYTDAGGVYLRSDNSDDLNAADSRRFGLVSSTNLVGRVISKVERHEPH